MGSVGDVFRPVPGFVLLRDRGAFDGDPGEEDLLVQTSPEVCVPVLDQAGERSPSRFVGLLHGPSALGDRARG